MLSLLLWVFTVCLRATKKQSLLRMTDSRKSLSLLQNYVLQAVYTEIQTSPRPCDSFISHGVLCPRQSVSLGNTAHTFQENLLKQLGLWKEERGGLIQSQVL